MAHSSKRNRTSRRTGSHQRRSRPTPQVAALPDLKLDERANRRFEIFVIVLLVAFGIYKSIVIFGAIPVPNPDYSGFVSTGKTLLNFRLPGSFKRAPVVGVLQVGLSYCVGGPHPVLTASWLLNAIFGTLSIVLVWQVGKRLIGDAAIWLAVITTLSPWIVRYQIVPIAETSLIFFALVTFYFIFKRSNWAYVFAAISPMVRYELISLILIAFLMDMVTKKTKKQRWQAFLWAFLASIPFLLWMLGTYLSWETSSNTHYIHNYADAVKKGGVGVRGSGFKRFIYLLWESAVGPLAKTPSAIKCYVNGYITRLQYDTVTAGSQNVYFYTKIVAWISVLVATVYGVVKRNWKILALLLFLMLYAAVHSLRIKSHSRYTVPAIWAVLMFLWTGLHCCWKVINRNNWIPAPLIAIMQGVVVLFAAVWLAMSVPSIPKGGLRCLSISTLPYASGLLIALLFTLRRFFFKWRFLGRDLAFAFVVCLMMVSQFFATIPKIGDGSYNIEFKQLADWYAENSEPGEKLACTWNKLLVLLADKYADDIVGIAPYKGTTMREFAENCHKNNIIYIAWTHRGSGAKTRRGMLHIQRILGPQADNEYMTLEHRVEIPSRENNRWINIYKLRPELPPEPPDIQKEEADKTNT